LKHKPKEITEETQKKALRIYRTIEEVISSGQDVLIKKTRDGIKVIAHKNTIKDEFQL